MSDDIRFPIGALFSVLGLILLLYGLLTGGSELYMASLGANVNLWTGVGMLIFGLAFLLLAYRSLKKRGAKE